MGYTELAEAEREDRGSARSGEGAFRNPPDRVAAIFKERLDRLLPEDLAHARFILWLRSSGLETPVAKALKKKNCDLLEEVKSLNYSVPLAEALLSAEPKYGSVANVQEAIRTGYPEVTSPTMGQALDFLQQVFGEKGNLPCTLLVVDEIQQFPAYQPIAPTGGA